MKAILLDGSNAGDITGERVRTTLMAQFQARGWDVEHIALREQKIGNCAGDFFCWVRTPGICNVNDDNRTISEALVNGDLMVYLTPVTFGGYSAILKGMVDHQIQNVSPFFTKIDGETHHYKRYRKNPDLLVAGWMDTPDPQSEALFHHLVRRNAINFYAKTWVSGVVHLGKSDREIEDLAQKWLGDVQGGHSSKEVMLPTMNTVGHEPMEIRRALLLVGSPKTRKSTSNSLGGYLLEQMGTEPIQTETIYLYTVLHNPQKMQALLEAVDAADLVALGGGQMLNGVPLAQAGGMAIRIRKALDLTAKALLQGQAIPQAAQEMMATPVIPHWAYRLMAGLGWLQAAKGYGALRILRRKPYLAATS